MSNLLSPLEVFSMIKWLFDLQAFPSLDQGVIAVFGVPDGLLWGETSDAHTERNKTDPVFLDQPEKLFLNLLKYSI